MIKEEKKDLFVHPYRPTNEEQDTISYLSSRMSKAVAIRSRSYREFNGLNLISYIDKSDKIYNSLQEKISFNGRDLSNLQSNIPRNKISAINSKISLNIPNPVILAWGNDGVLSGGGTKVLQGLNDWTEENKNARILNIKKGNELFVHGTTCTFNDFEHITREVDDIEEMSLNPKTKKRIITERYGCFTRIIPLQEIYLSSFFISDIQRQPWIIWKRTFSEGEFKTDFNKETFYKNTENVVSGKVYRLDGDAYFSIEAEELSDDKISVIKLFDKRNDRIITVANGVLIQDVPFIWKHKKYPFCWTQNDFFSNTDFAYGMSVPHKLSWDVNAIEFLVNAAFEQAKISVNPPMINYGLTEFEDDVLYAGRVIKSEGQQGDIQTLDIKGVGNDVFAMINMFSSNADLATVDAVGQGVSSGGRGVTARRDVMAQENLKSMLGIPFTMLMYLQKQETELQVANIQQFYTKKIKETIVGKDGKEKVEELYKTFTIFDTPIDRVNFSGTSSGKARGIRQVVIDDDEMPSGEINKRESMAMLNDIQLEVLSPSAQSIRNLKWFVRIPYSDDYLASSDTKYNKLANTIGLGIQLAPELINKEENLKELYKLSGQDSEKLLLSEPEEKQREELQPRDDKGSTASNMVESSLRNAEDVQMGMPGGMENPEIGGMMQ